MAEWCKSCMQPLGREQALGLCPECIEDALNDRAEMRTRIKKLEADARLGRLVRAMGEYTVLSRWGDNTLGSRWTHTEGRGELLGSGATPEAALGHLEEGEKDAN